ncbi:hypothetical protein ERX46_15655 [Brumimicrobium glaciale]|uniref:Uncharacterized protein n=1 Tax=Brumimicrobium glaciale TaxID=200475 RepID=A0A4V1WF65_9FLAO|nr:hypothetical protein [Brumimicrobium glaciale]RYM32116.1 hypothetical protein ERX46_15655 [Brumimicrobium glaciale]
MKFNFWIIIFLISPNLVFTQNYFEYYQGINKGRTLVSTGNIEESLQSYFSTFEKFDFVFARDCFNAIEISAITKDTVKLDYFIRRGIKQGLDLKLILKVKKLSEYHNSTFIHRIEKDNDSLKAVYTESINWELRNEMIAMFTADQAVRERFYDAILFKRSKIGKEWEALNRVQVERIIEITKKHGFPGEKLIGIDTPEMHSKIGDYNLSAGMPIVIFIHHYSQPNISYAPLLFKQIEAGNLYNEHFATISDFEVKFGKGKHENHGFFAFKQTLKNTNEQEVNKRRNEIELLSIEKFEELNKSKVITRFWNRLY